MRAVATGEGPPNRMYALWERNTVTVDNKTSREGRGRRPKPSLSPPPHTPTALAYSQTHPEVREQRRLGRNVARCGWEGYYMSGTVRNNQHKGDNVKISKEGIIIVIQAM